MKRRLFIKSLAALPIDAGLPAFASTPIHEELLEGIIYISQTFDAPNGFFTETWRKANGKVYRTITSEEKIISVTEESYCPFVKVPWVAPTS